MAASQCGHLRVVERLLAAGASTNHQAQFGRFALCEAARKGHFDILQRLIDAGADVNLSWGDGTTALILAVQGGDGAGAAAAVGALIAAGADLEAHELLSGFTALMQASVLGRADVVFALVKAGADAGATDKQGRTAKELAQLAGQDQSIRMLMR